MDDTTLELAHNAAHVYYATVFAVAFICGVSRTLRNGDYTSILHCLSVGLFAGCLSCALVAIFGGDPDSFLDRTYFYLGVSAFIGLSGKEGVILIQYVLGKALMTLGIDLKSAKSSYEKSRKKIKDE